MPKVNIYDPSPRGVNIETGEQGPEILRRVSVGWARGTHVQVGLGWVDPAATLESVPRAAGFAPDFITSGETDEHGRIWQSQWCDMDRHTINQLIRELRTARDQAFGRDE